VGRSITANVLEVDGIRHFSTDRPESRVARLVGTLADSQSLAAVLQHLWHEGQLVEMAVGIERAENFFLASHLDPFSNTKAKARFDCVAHGCVRAIELW
jgi:hypothetical protein